MRRRSSSPRPVAQTRRRLRWTRRSTSTADTHDNKTCGWSDGEAPWLVPEPLDEQRRRVVLQLAALMVEDREVQPAQRLGCWPATGCFLGDELDESLSTEELPVEV